MKTALRMLLAAMMRARWLQQPAGHSTQQDGHEGAHLHHAVAAGELALIQVLRQVGELQRSGTPARRRFGAL